MVQALRDDPRRDDRTVALSFGGLQWGTVMGVLDHGLRSGVPMCIATEAFAATVPARDVCDGGADEWPVLIAPRELRRSGGSRREGPACRYRRPGTGREPGGVGRRPPVTYC